jgi:hypothetical protein
LRDRKTKRTVLVMKKIEPNTTDNIISFSEQLLQFKVQFERIYDIMDWQIGKDFDGLSVDMVYDDYGNVNIYNSDITYKCSTHWSGCGREVHNQSVTIAELAQSEQYWIIKKDAFDKIKAEEAAYIDKCTEEKEKEKLKELLEKYPEVANKP